MATAVSTQVPRSLCVVDDSGTHEIFEVIGMHDGLLRVRAAYRFEVGEEIKVRLEEADGMFDAVAQIREYTSDGLAALELHDRAPARTVISG